MICKNCNTAFEGNFCNNCGQSAETHKLNLHFLWHDIQHGLFHFDKGLFFSAKQLFFRPGSSIREFIEGKRVRHFKPISMVIVLATIYGLLYHSFDINLFNSNEEEATKLQLDLNHSISKHYSWLTIILLPLYTLGTYIAFKKQGYNYIEYFILNTFKASQRLILHIVLFPILFYYNGTQKISSVTFILYIADVILIYWTNVQFFNKLSAFKIFILTILSHLIFLLCIVSIIVVLILFYK